MCLLENIIFYNIYYKHKERRYQKITSYIIKLLAKKKI